MNKIIKKLFAPIAVFSLALGVGLVASRETIEVNAAPSGAITNYASITPGDYYIGATTSSIDYYLSVDGSTAGNSIAGNSVTSTASATIFTFAGSGTSWTIKFKNTANYLGLSSAKDNGKVQVLSSSQTLTASNKDTLIALRNGSLSTLSKNSGGLQFGNYQNTQPGIWLVSAIDLTYYTVSFDSDGGTPAPASLAVSQNGTFTFPSPGTKSGYVFDGWSSDGGTTKFSAGTTSPAVTAAINYTAYWSAAPTLQSINITGSLSKTSYFTTDSWSPAGLAVTGTYSSGPTQDVTSQVTWSYNPTAPNNVSITSVTVTATLGSQTDSEIITGITVSEKVSTIVISEAYGGGGNSGATLKQDFIELYNNSNDNINLNGYYLFYASAAGSFSDTGNYTELSGTILAKSYFLVQEAAGSGGTVDIPTSDFVGTIESQIAMSGQNFKLALTNSAVAPTSATDANVIDFVGAGTANAYEGSAAAPALSNSTSVARVITSGVAIDTNVNSADFTAGAPTPMNGAFSVAGRIMAYEGGDLITAECATKYSTIKAQMLLLSSGSLTYFQNSTESNIQNARFRYVAWSVANGDNTPYSAARARGRNLISSNNEENRLVAVITISVLGLTTILGYYFLKKKKFLQ